MAGWSELKRWRDLTQRSEAAKGDKRQRWEEEACRKNGPVCRLNLSSVTLLKVSTDASCEVVIGTYLILPPRY